ncbi:unnamed protein product, partial [Meganyctiphanes norvegica]
MSMLNCMCVHACVLFFIFGKFSERNNVPNNKYANLYATLSPSWIFASSTTADRDHSRSQYIVKNRIRLDHNVLVDNAKIGVFKPSIARNYSYYDIDYKSYSAPMNTGACLGSQAYVPHRISGGSTGSQGSDSQRLYKARPRGVVFGPRCGAGDRMGCGIKFDQHSPENDPSLVPVFFTKNGKEIGSVQVRLPSGGLYPCVGLAAAGDSVRLQSQLSWLADEDTHMSVDSTEDEWLSLHDIRLNGQALEYCGRGKSLVDVGLAQARVPLNTTAHYFEMEIVDSGKSGYITIGLTRKDYPKYRHPGWNHGSIAYHADDGRIFTGSTVGSLFGPRCRKGDVMGCGIIFPRDYVCNYDSSGSCLPFPSPFSPLVKECDKLQHQLFSYVPPTKSKLLARFHP